jgi:hypothetical protein
MNDYTISHLHDLIQHPKGYKHPAPLNTLEGGFAKGWFFEVHKVFRAALDSSPDGKGGYSQGSNFCFKEGDMLYSSERGYITGETAEMCIQVKTSRPAIPADRSAKKERDPGWVEFIIYTYKGGFRERLTKKTTQDEFVEFLIGGPRMAGWEDVAEIAISADMIW